MRSRDLLEPEFRVSMEEGFILQTWYSAFLVPGACREGKQNGISFFIHYKNSRDAILRQTNEYYS